MSDLISRQAVLDGLEKYHDGADLHIDGLTYAYDLVCKLPSVSVAEKTGHWIEEDMFDGDVAYRCSECNELFWIESGTPKDNEYNFCPKCGAKLVGERMSNKEAVETLILFCVRGGGVIDTKVMDAIRLAIRSLEVLQEVKKIIDTDNTYIQEDVMKYKIICNIVDKAYKEIEYENN